MYKHKITQAYLKLRFFLSLWDVADDMLGFLTFAHMPKIKVMLDISFIVPDVRCDRSVAVSNYSWYSNSFFS